MINFDWRRKSLRIHRSEGKAFYNTGETEGDKVKIVKHRCINLRVFAVDYGNQRTRA
jgi:hypothetical protein